MVDTGAIQHSPIKERWLVLLIFLSVPLAATGILFLTYYVHAHALLLICGALAGTLFGWLFSRVNPIASYPGWVWFVLGWGLALCLDEPSTRDMDWEGRIHRVTFCCLYTAALAQYYFTRRLPHHDDATRLLRRLRHLKG